MHTFFREIKQHATFKSNMTTDFNTDESIFANAFDQYHRLLYALAFRYLKSMEDAEDAVQHTFMKLWEQRDTFDLSAGIRSLLFTILKNYILNELRHQKIVLQKHYEMAQADAETELDFTDLLADQDFRQHLYAIVNQLPAQKREVCLLKMEQGLSNQEVADQMQISVPTVKSHYTQALKILRTEISKLLLSISLLITQLNGLN